MKKLLFIIMVSFPLVTIGQTKTEFSLTGQAIENKNANSQVEQKEGILIFSYSKPTSSYRVIGTAKPNLLGSSDCGSLIDQLVKKIKKRYPTAQGLIILIDEYSKFKDCEVIEFIK
jgi:hypothetical protein